MWLSSDSKMGIDRICAISKQNFESQCMVPLYGSFIFATLSQSGAAPPVWAAEWR